jgi:signal transduction histidine kinase
MDFAAVAHDLRTPLNVMLGHMRLLAAEPVSEAARKRLEVLEAQIHRMVRLLDSCREQPNQPPYLVPVDLNATIRSLVMEFEVILDRRAIRLVVRDDGLLPLVLGDGDLLHRVLVNVLTNAADSIACGGRIEIATRVEHLADERSPTIHIDVADTGAGIPPDLIPRVFEYGFTTKQFRRGHGLGLGICRDILKMHGGHIELLGDVGCGTTVRLSIPASL